VAQKLAALELGAFEYANGLTDHAVEEREVIDGNVAKTMKSMPKKSVEDARLPFEPEDMTRIFSSPLPERSGVAPRTLFWILMLAPSTGCRLDELGKLQPDNIKTYDGIPYQDGVFAGKAGTPALQHRCIFLILWSVPPQQNDQTHMVDGEPSNSRSPVAAGTELKTVAREIVRRWVRDASDVILDRIGEGAMRASSDATAHLPALVEGRSAQTIIADVERSIAAWDTSPPPPRFPWLRGRQQTAPGLPIQDVDTLVMRLDAERDDSTRRMILLTSTRDRLARTADGLEQALTTIELLRPMIESAARELRVEQPERAPAVQERGSAILLEREQVLLTQQAIHHQAELTLDLLVANQTVLDKAIVQARTATVSALQVAMAARQAMNDQTRIDPGLAAERTRDKLRSALAEAHQAMETLASRDNSTSSLDL
jgi:hypothetical protein